MGSPPPGQAVGRDGEEPLAALLSRLDPDQTAAGQKYLELHLKLTRFFERRDVFSSEEHADEVIDRVSRKVAAGEQIESLGAYALGVAKRYFLELTRKPRFDSLDDDNALRAEPGAPAPAAEDARLACLDECVGRLGEGDRLLLFEYYEEERVAKIDSRRLIAQRLGVTANALRLRVFKLRAGLEKCIKACEEGGATGLEALG